MKIKHYDYTFPYVLIDEIYNEEELNLIWEELNFLCNEKNFLRYDSPEVYAARDPVTDNVLKRNKSLWLDSFYTERNSSNILNLNRKIFFDDNYQKIFKEHPSWLFKNFRCTKDVTFLSYYENGDYYKTHSDLSVFTVLTWFYKEPKKFDGGDFYIIHDDTFEFKIKNNQTLIFPSILKHEVSEVKMNLMYENKKMGRFCMTQFLTYDT
jgi:Rps23 Pro-64 3,4-dihydroxylase Tpa1-like proline 4-hydroxylase